MGETSIQRVRALSEAAIRRVVPDEEGLFAAVWEGCAPWVERVLDRASDGGVLKRVSNEAASALLALTGGMETVDLISPVIVAVITTSAVRLAALGAMERAGVREIVRESASDLDLKARAGVETERVEEAITDLLEVDLGRISALRPPESVGEATTDHHPSLTRYGEHYPVLIQVNGAKQEDEPLTRDQVVDIWQRYDRKLFAVVVNETSREVELPERSTDMAERPLRLLVALLLARGFPVDHDTLIGYIWPGKEDNYTESDVAQAKLDLCEALGMEGKMCDEYVKSVRGGGYCWVGPDSYVVIARGARGK